MAKPSLDGNDHPRQERRAGQLLAASEELESTLESIDMEDQQDLADAVIVGIRAADGAIQRELANRSGR